MPDPNKTTIFTPVNNRRVNTLMEVIQKPGEIEDAAFLHSVLCQTFLPYRNPGKDVREYERTQGNATLLLKAGEVFNPRTKKFKKVGLPYGHKARLVLAYVNTWAIKTQSPVVQIEGTLTSFVRKLGLDTGGKTITSVKEQLSRLAGSTIRVGYATSDDTARTAKLDIIDNMEMWL